MKKISFLICVLLFVSISNAQRPLVIEGATLIDGNIKPPVKNSVIVIQGTKISVVGKKGKVKIPTDAVKIDARGKYIIPGLIDAHIHYDSPRDLIQLLAWGVTSANCMFESTDDALNMQNQTSGDSVHAPQIYATAPIFSTEHGWWWGEGFPNDSSVNRFPSTPAEAKEQIRKVKAKGIQRIKLMYDNMDWCRDPLPPFSQMQQNVMNALIREARAQGMFTEVHAPKLRDAVQAIDAGVSAFAHGILDHELDEFFMQAIEGKKVFYVPTMCLYEFLADVSGFMQHALADERFRSALPDEQRIRYSSPEYYNRYRERYPNITFVKEHLEILRQNMTKIMEGEVEQEYFEQNITPEQIKKTEKEREKEEREHPREQTNVALGTDMWAFPGIGAHLELEYMSGTGIQPLEVLSAATRVGAKFLGRESVIGTVEAGKQADLLILDSNPLKDIRNTRSIRTIIKHGVVFDHQKLIEESKR